MTKERVGPENLDVARFQAFIQRILPHRFPWLLVDRVTEFVPGERIRGRKLFSGGEEYLQGHFPSAPLSPSAVMLEACVQLGAILVLERPGLEGKAAVLLGVPSATFHRPLVPGDVVELEASIVRIRGAFGELRGRGFLNGELVAEGQVRFAVANAADFLTE